VSTPANDPRLSNMQLKVHVIVMHSLYSRIDNLKHLHIRMMQDRFVLLIAVTNTTMHIIKMKRVQ